MITLISIELYKIFRKWRTYISFLTIGLLILLIEIVWMIEGKDYQSYLTRSFRDSFVLVGNFVNGYLIAYTVLMSLFVHIPFLIALVSGDLMAGEATAGTYRVLLTRPVSRFQVVTSKYIAGIIYTSAVIVFLALMSAGIGTLLLGSGELIVFGEKIIIYKSSDVLWRFLSAWGFAILSMSVITSIAIFFSSLVNNAIGPIVATMAIVIIFLIISNLNIGFLNNITPYLFTNYINSWNVLFEDPVDYGFLWKSVLVLAGHVVGFYLITLMLFRRKDITS